MWLMGLSYVLAIPSIGDDAIDPGLGLGHNMSDVVHVVMLVASLGIFGDISLRAFGRDDWRTPWLVFTILAVAGLIFTARVGRARRIAVDDVLELGDGLSVAHTATFVGYVAATCLLVTASTIMAMRESGRAVRKSALALVAFGVTGLAYVAHTTYMLIARNEALREDPGSALMWAVPAMVCLVLAGLYGLVGQRSR